MITNPPLDQQFTHGALVVVGTRWTPLLKGAYLIERACVLRIFMRRSTARRRVILVWGETCGAFYSSTRFTGVVLDEDEELRLAAVAAVVEWTYQQAEASVGPNTSNR